MKDTLNMRTEPRMETADLESYSFILSGYTERVPLDMVVMDKSNSGLGCACAPNPFLFQGAMLELWDMMIYEIRWVIQVSKNICQVGLKLVKEMP